ncbi:MAG: hypothetical protein CMH30_06620 [Micavibrio sp.]|nr:hypothetical protein [Micavibrio sp.]
MVLEVYIYAIAFLTLGICFYAAWHDVASLTIHNGTVVTIMLTFAACFCLNTYAVYIGVLDHSLFASLADHIVSMGIVFAICFFLFCTGTFGGGDAKMATALALWIPLIAIPAFVMVMALVGGVLGLVALALRKRSFLKPHNETGWIAALSRGESTVPYGIALAIAAAYSFHNLGYLGV